MYATHSIAALLPIDLGQVAETRLSGETDGFSVFDSYLSSPKYMILLLYFSPVWGRDVWIYLGAVWLPVLQSIYAGDHSPMALCFVRSVAAIKPHLRVRGKGYCVGGGKM